jgi:hypothetical protein
MSQPEHTDEFSDEEKKEFDDRADEAFDGEETIDIDEWIEAGE